MVEMRRARTRMKSLRSLIAIGGVAAMAFGVAQATGTMAVPTDAVNSTGAQVATGNFYPTPLPVGNISCSNNGLSGFRDITMSWPAAGAGTSFKVFVVQGTSVKDGPWYQAGTSRNINWDYKGSGTYHVVVQAVSDADTTIAVAAREVSSGSLRSAFYHNGLNDMNCTGNPWRIENQDWENAKFWDPATPDPNGSAARGMAPEVFEMDLEQDLTEAPKADGTTTQVPATTPETSTTTQTPTTTPTMEAPPTTTTESATPTTTTTVAPTTTTTTTTPPKLAVVALSAPEVSTSGATATLVQTDTGAAVVVTNSSGAEISSTPVSSNAELKWDSDGQLWIVDGGTIYKVSSSGTATTVTAADAPADIATWIDGLQ